MSKAARALIVAALLLCTAPALLPVTVTPAQSAPPTFTDTFDGSPAAPQAFLGSTTWDVMAHKRDENSSSFGPQGGMDGMSAHHGSNCDPYPATHSVGALPQAVFYCRDHLMTAINAGDYGALVLTPNHLIDFTAGEAVIRFDISTLRVSNRDWWDVWITPWDGAVPMPLRDPFLPDGYGVPQNAVFFDIGDQNTLGAAVVRNGQITQHDGRWWEGGYDRFLSQSATTRTTVEMRISRTHLKIGLPQFDYYWVDEDVAALPFTVGVVQFGHHSYTPTKGGTGPNTWHWDNVSIGPAVPFTMLQTNEDPGRYITAGTVLTFNQPAPADALARFHVKGQNPTVSFDGGQTWVAPTRLGFNNELKAFKVAVPVGATTMRINASPNQWSNSWWARNVSVMARGGNPGPPTTATATATRTPTATMPPATATATATATSVPATATVAPATATMTPTATPMPPTATATATATAPLRCRVQVWDGSNWIDHYEGGLVGGQCVAGAGPTATPTPEPTATATRTPTPPPPPTPTNTPAPTGRFVTLPPGAALPSGAECAARVRPAPENRPGNAAANARTGHQMTAMAGFNDAGNAALAHRVDGNFTGTTDEIIQWAACKWGFDEDIARAVAVTESWWNQSNVGDNGESFGLMQVREPYHPDTFPDSRDSTAFNVDYTLGSRRGCFEGYEPWLTGTVTGDEWGCVGSWFSGRWHDAPAEQYISVVRGHLDNRTWAQPGF